MQGLAFAIVFGLVSAVPTAYRDGILSGADVETFVLAAAGAFVSYCATHPPKVDDEPILPAATPKASA